MTILSQIWRRITSTRHSRALESEIARQGGELARQRAEVTRQRAENDQMRAAIASQQNEIARLRAENRALLNSILGIAGIPPVIVDTPLPSSVPIPEVPFPSKCHSESAAADDESRSTPSHPSSTAAEKNSPGTQNPRNDIPPNPSPESSSLHFSSPAPRRHLATPLRRRSWHQIMRTLELASAKKPSSTD